VPETCSEDRPLCYPGRPGPGRRIAPISVAREQALVIGNATCARAPLKNPVNDAAAMEATLKILGFEVQTLRDLDLPRMEAAVDEFTAGLASGSLGYDAKYYGQSPTADPAGPASGTLRVLRGDSWSDYPKDARVSNRYRGVPESRLNVVGFRCAGELNSL
jgi:hypothetical protein